MEQFIHDIFASALQEQVSTITELVGLGSVNRIFNVQGKQAAYIIRINDDPAKQVEYLKEHWCLNAVAAKGIPSPKVLQTGHKAGLTFMIQEKLPGTNGKHCPPKDQLIIWKHLGAYAALFNKIKRIEVEEVNSQEFHKDWRARLIYNIKELNTEDSLLRNKVLSSEEHQSMKKVLKRLEQYNFATGLTHGDLCPRNAIWREEQTYLLDWGTAEINIVPHSEIGLVLFSKEADPNAFQAFLSGMGISRKQYSQMENEIHLVNLLHQLDKYRWAETYDPDNISGYEKRIIEAFSKVKMT